MKIQKFQVDGLFNLYNHCLDFTSRKPPEVLEGASVTMIYGENGIGKTTILRMIDGLMTLNFTIFRKIVFKKASLTFSTGKSISVEPFAIDKKLAYLLVRYEALEAKLNPIERGPLSEEDSMAEDIFVQVYRDDLDKFSYDFIDTERLLRTSITNEMRFEQAVNKGKIVRKSHEFSESFLVNKVKDFCE